MSRILKKLQEYDSSITIADLILKIENEYKEVIYKEELEEEHIKSEFENSYLKFVDEMSIFGSTLRIFQLKSFVRKERTTDWEFTYYFEGNRFSFSLTSIHHERFNTDRCDNSFSKEELKSMVKITESEYETYFSKYLNLKEELEDLIVL